MPKRKAGGRKSQLSKVWIDAALVNVVMPGLMIRNLRRQRRMTQEQLSARCQVLGLNLTRGTLAKIEARLRFLKACELFIIAKVLRVPMESFYPPSLAARRGR
ncbi:MAG: helix-turn-helix domain-containing protein [Limisphaerales bacterium]